MTSLADAVERTRRFCEALDVKLRAEAVADLRLILDALDRASPEAVRDNVAVAIAERFLCQPKSLFAQALADYLIRHDRIAADLERGLFWVLPPSGPAQVATFLPLFDPRAPDHFERGAHLSVESDPDIGAI